jgi:serine/threonine-protein kinase
MPLAPAAALLETLQRGRLLEAAQTAELAATQPPFPDAHALAKDLIRRGWLTPYQMNKVFQGKTAELVLGQYVLLERLGEGGMGAVFKARHRLMNRIVALKLIKPELLAHPHAQERFRHEIQAAAKCVHPNIVIAHDADEVDGKHYLTMELVTGSNLATLVKTRGPLPINIACDFARQAACGLAHAHEKGLVHRDIKPSNLLLIPAADGQPGGTIKILDLGLARLRGTGSRDTTKEELTEPGAVVGTADYMAPEQALDSRQADIRADIYSLGCTLYFLLAGQPPFPGGTSMEKLFSHHQMEPLPIEHCRPEVSPELVVVLRKMMAKKREERFQTPNEVAAALQPFCTNEPAPVVQVMAASAVPVAVPTGWTAVTDNSATAPDYELPAPDYVPSQAFALPPRHRRRGWYVACAAVISVLAIGLLWYWRPARPVAQITTAAAVTQPTDDSKFTNSIGMSLVRLAAGKFRMGSPNTEAERQANEGPVHEVTLTRPFYLGTCEVTVGQFRAFVNATNYHTQAESSGEGARRMDPAQGGIILDPDCTWRKPRWAQSDSFPVVCVSWNDAKAFCDWLSRQEKRTYRLPTEAEWEYACRAGTTTVFSFGDSLSSEQANFIGSAPYGEAPRGPTLQKPCEVGSYQANGFGLFDMHGNVEEWCADYYDAYDAGPQVDPVGAKLGSLRVFRGGSWGNSGGHCRAAGRKGAAAADRVDIRGFRVVCHVK